MFKKHGLKMNLDKTEVMSVGKQREELNIRLEGKDVKVNNVMYLGGNISENGHVDVEVRRRIQAGANAWSNVVTHFTAKYQNLSTLGVYPTSDSSHICLRSF